MEFAESEANGKEQVVIFNFDSKHAKVLPILGKRNAGCLLTEDW
jgi:hypothetical protein